jgi:hypothetical protein
MKKSSKAFKATAFITAFCFIIFAFAGCKKETDGKSIVDDRGVTYLVVTEENGENVTDEAGNLIVYDNLGETQRVATPDYYNDADKIVTKYYSVVPPKGWTAEPSGKGDVELTHEKTGNIVKLVTVSKDLEGALIDLEEIVQSVAGEGAKTETSQKELYGVTATVSSIQTGSGAMEFNVFKKGEKVFSFYTVKSKDFKNNDAGFEEVLNAVVFK